MELFDTHCHLDVSEFDSDRLAVIRRARQAGVNHFLVPATTSSSWPQVEALCNRESTLYPAYGLHPVYTHLHRAEDISALKQWVSTHKTLAIGEIGLDFMIRTSDRKRQVMLLEQQLSIAEEAQLPVILHVRKAHDQVLLSLKKYSLPGGICHAFNGSIQQAEKYMKMGFKFGFGGMLTFERSSKLRELARQLPIECIVLETDSPDMTVASHQYQRNSPEYLPEILNALATVRHEKIEKIGQITTLNAFDVLNL